MWRVDSLDLMPIHRFLVDSHIHAWALVSVAGLSPFVDRR